MKLVKVNKQSYLKYSNEFENLPISFNPDLEGFLLKKGFKETFYVLKINQKCIGLLPVYNKNKNNFSVPYFSYGLILKITLNDRVIKNLRNVLKKNLINFKIKLVGSINDNIRLDKVSSFLSLKQSTEIQLNSFKSKLRSQIRKGYKNGLKCKIGGKEFINDFWEIYSRNLHNLGSPSYSKNFFYLLFENLNENQIKIFIILHDSKPIGSSLCLSYNSFCEVILASTLKDYNQLSPNMMMYWEMIANSIESKKTIFSFGRSDLNSSQLRFKKQWGVNLVPIMYLNSNEKILNLKFLKKIFSRIWKFIPYRVSKYFGYLIAEKFY